MIDYTEVTLVEVSKMGDWKNISQRETEARNARRSKKKGAKAAAVGGIGVAYGGVEGATRASNMASSANTQYKTMRIARHPKGRAANSALNAVNRGSKLYSPNAKARTVATVGGGLLAATGAGLYAQGSAKERHNEKRIAGMRKKRDK